LTTRPFDLNGPYVMHWAVSGRLSANANKTKDRAIAESVAKPQSIDVGG
jgi:hypothetical protein